MHGAATLFGHAVALGVAKSVSFEKKSSVRFRNCFKKVLQIKKFKESPQFNHLSSQK
jgi:hypothetical protein